MTANPYIPDEINLMIGQSLVDTKPLNLCCSCGVEVRELDKFCRRCGTRQGTSGKPSFAGCDGYDKSPAINKDHYPTPNRTDLSANFGLGHLVSGPLLIAVALGVISNASMQLNSNWARRTILSLISVPIWLMIILLSPLDAYAIAKAIISQMKSSAN